MLGAILRLFPHKTADLEADLHGVSGFTGRGELEYAAWSNGVQNLEIELRGVAGVSADVFANGIEITRVPLTNGRVDAHLDTRRGDAFPALTEGAEIEIRQNGQPILAGVLVRD